MNLMEEILTKKITLEEAYCKGHNYIASLLISDLNNNDRHTTAILNTINFVESALAQKYMEEKGYIRDNQAGIDIWRKKV